MEMIIGTLAIVAVVGVLFYLDHRTREQMRRQKK